MSALLHAMRPAGLGWVFLTEVTIDGTRSDLWYHAASSTQVLSSLIQAILPRSGRVGPQWLVSVTDRPRGLDPRRPRPEQVALARCAFDMLTAEEDNHHPGASRHFFLPVDSSERVDCECKATETTVEDADGYRWSNTTEGPCRGCEHERLMRAAGIRRPCPIHTTPKALDTRAP